MSPMLLTQQSVDEGALYRGRPTLSHNAGICSDAVGTQRGVGSHSSLAELESVSPYANGMGGPR